MRILINGAGVAGLTAGMLLLRQKHEVTVLDRKDGPEAAGYFLNIVGRALGVLRDLDVFARLREVNVAMPTTTIMTRDGKAVRSFDISAMSDPDALGLFITRTDLEDALVEGAKDAGLELRYGISVESLTQEEGAQTVAVRTTDGTEDQYDLVIGADGISSAVRSLLFPEAAPIDLGLGFFAFRHKFPSEFPVGSYTMLDVGRSLALSSSPAGELGGLFWFLSEKSSEELRVADLESILGGFRDFGGVVPELIDGIVQEGPDAFFVDKARQVHLESSWSQGRVGLIGDAAYAVSPVAAKGASLALLGASALARAVSEEDDATAAFTQTFTQLARTASVARDSAKQNAQFLVPKDEKHLASSTKFMSFIPSFVMKWLAKSAFRELY